MILLANSPRMLEAPAASAHGSSSSSSAVKELFASLRRLRSGNHVRSSAHTSSTNNKALPLTPAPTPLPSPRPPSPPSPRTASPPRVDRQDSMGHLASFDGWTSAYQSGRLDVEPSRSLPSPLHFLDEAYMPPTPPAERPRSGSSVASSSSRGSSVMSHSGHFGPLTTEPRPYGISSPVSDSGRERFSIHLETVTEGQPLRPESTAESIKWEMEALARSGRRPSLAPSIESCPSSDVARIDFAPLVLKRSSVGQAGYQLASPFPIAVPSSVSSCFDITTQQAAELLNLDFVALLAVPDSSTTHTSSIHLLSSHNLPIPAPLWSISAHLDILAQEAHAVAYSSAISDLSGLIVKVRSSKDMSFLLCGYSFENRVYTLEELSCLEHFARDIRSNLKKL